MVPFHFKMAVFLILLESLLLFNIFSVNYNAFGLSHQVEISTLLQMKRGFISGELDTWLPGTDCCMWEGVTCDESRRVISLDLSNRSIIGTISPSLFNLSSLRTINFAYNQFDQMTIPDSGWEKLPNLSSLNFSHAGFVGKVPTGIFYLTKLTSLDLSVNSELFFTGNPTFLGNMSNLRELYLDYVDLSPHGDKWCGALANFTPLIEALRMNMCSLFGTSCASLSLLPFLSVITLRGNNLDSNILDSLTNFSSLSELEIQENEFKGFFPKPIFQLRKLKYLDISSNPRLSGSLPDFPKDSNLKSLVLSGTNFSGCLPSTIGNLRFLLDLDISSCQFSGIIPSSIGNLSYIVTLYLSNNNKLCGQVPRSLFQLSRLVLLSLASNNFHGVVELDFIKNLKNLLYLDLSNSGLTLSQWDTDDGSSSSSLPIILYLGLASCNLTKIPAFLEHQHQMRSLDLSNNIIQGEIPSWLWNISESSHLLNINWFFSLANNKLTGEISPLICNLTGLWLLDLSMNMLTGSIPQCLFEETINLHVLNLRGNQLHGAIPKGISPNCELQTIILRDNQLVGLLPRSLSKCLSLEILDVGNNKLRDIFPHWLGNMPLLRVLVIRSNKFYGKVWPLSRDHETNYNFSMLHVFDISSNNLNGKLCGECFSNFKSIMVNKVDLTNIFEDNFIGHYYDLDVLTIMSKGQLMTLQNFWIIFKSIDISNNHFEGEIPFSIGKLISLQVLNMSHNNLTGKIPSQLGNLPQLESLDLSMNSLYGMIPQELVSLHFLSYLNLSHNKLIGKIPLEGQFSTFPNTSFEGNQGLCWFPYNTSIMEVCNTMTSPGDLNGIVLKNKIYMIVFGLLFGMGFGGCMAIIVVFDVMCYIKGWRSSNR